MKKTCLTSAFLLFLFTQLFASDISEEDKKLAVTNYLHERYKMLTFAEGEQLPAFDVYKRGMLGYMKLKSSGLIKNDLLTVIDFRISSTKKRLWIIDIKTNQVLHHSLVAHGKNSGWDIPQTFSNTPNSNTSSLGFYLTGEKYIGKYGLSLRLDGVERGFNDNARRRAIVMHPAQYVNTSITKTIGRLGRSFGCPAIPYKDSDKVVKMIADKSVMLIYFPQKDYLQKTEYSDETLAYSYLMKSGVAI